MADTPRPDAPVVRVVDINDSALGVLVTVEISETDGLPVGVHLHADNPTGALRLVGVLTGLGLLIVPTTPSHTFTGPLRAVPTPPEREPADAIVASLPAGSPDDTRPPTQSPVAGQPEHGPGVVHPPNVALFRQAPDDDVIDDEAAGHVGAQSNNSSAAGATNGRTYRRAPEDAELKQAFKDLKRDGITPTAKALGEYFDVPDRTAGGWVRRARERGVKI